MNKLVQCASWSGGVVLASLIVFACSSVDEKPAAPAPKPAAAAPAAKPPAAAPAPAPAKTEAVKATKTKAVEVEGVISAVGQRTITFQMERKGKVREEVVGVDDKTKIEKGGANVKLERSGSHRQRHDQLRTGRIYAGARDQDYRQRRD